MLREHFRKTKLKKLYAFGTKVTRFAVFFIKQPVQATNFPDKICYRKQHYCRCSLENHMVKIVQTGIQTNKTIYSNEQVVPKVQ